MSVRLVSRVGNCMDSIIFNNHACGLSWSCMCVHTHVEATATVIPVQLQAEPVKKGPGKLHTQAGPSLPTPCLLSVWQPWGCLAAVWLSGLLVLTYRAVLVTMRS